MTAELGHAALIVALCLAVAQTSGAHGGFVCRLQKLDAPGPFASGRSVCAVWRCHSPASRTPFYWTTSHLAYVANNSNTLLPVQFKVSAVWGCPRGVPAALGTNFGRLVCGRRPVESRAAIWCCPARVLSVLGGISSGICLVLAADLQPFRAHLAGLAD